MEIGNYKFGLVCRIEPERDEFGRVRAHLPQGRYRSAASLPLNKYGDGPFCKFQIPRTYNLSGVYALLVSGKIHYIGECENLSARYNMGYGNISPRNCFKGGQETNCRINNLIYLAASEGNEIELWFHPSASFKAAEVELLAMERRLWNRK